MNKARPFGRVLFFLKKCKSISLRAGCAEKKDKPALCSWLSSAVALAQGYFGAKRLIINILSVEVIIAVIFNRI